MLLPAADEDEVSAGLELDELEDVDELDDELDELDAFPLLLLEHPVRTRAVAIAAVTIARRVVKAAIASPVVVAASCGECGVDIQYWNEYPTRVR